MLSWVPTGWEGIISCPGNRQEANSPMTPQLCQHSLLAPTDSARHQHWAASSYSRQHLGWLPFTKLLFSIDVGEGYKKQKIKIKENIGVGLSLLKEIL